MRPRDDGREPMRRIGWRRHAPVDHDAPLVLSGVSVTFGGVRAVREVSATCTGPVTGIVGPNGAGKTTMLNVISGIVRPRTGTVRLGRLDLTRAPAHAHARIGIARSFQTPVLVPALTVRENLATVPAGGDFPFDRVVAMIGLRRWLRVEVGALPYGARKLLDVGRALLTGPRILLCDEPLSGLDDAERDHMVALLREIADGGVRLVVIEHDVPRIRRLADQLIVMNLGSKIADGPPAEVLGRNEVIAAFIGSGGGGADEPSGPVGPEV